MTFFEELQCSLLEAIDIERNRIPMVEREGMPAPTFVAESLAGLVNPQTKVGLNDATDNAFVTPRD